MDITQQEKNRNARKQRILDLFSGDERLYINQIAKAIGVAWPTTERLVNALVEEGRLIGNKYDGFALYETVETSSLWQKVKRFLHVPF